jgi:hypothetical protein
MNYSLRDIVRVVELYSEVYNHYLSSRRGTGNHLEFSSALERYNREIPAEIRNQMPVAPGMFDEALEKIRTKKSVEGLCDEGDKF